MSKSKYQNPKYGFTLLEILVSVSIIAGLSILIAQAFFTTTRSNTKTEILKEVKQNGDLALGLMSRMVRESTSITSSCPSTGLTSTSLSIKNPDGATTTFGCVYDGSVTRIASSSGALSDYLTSSSVTLGDTSCAGGAMTLSFTCTARPAGGSTVTMSFTLSQAGVPVNLFQRAQSSFQTTIDTRNQ